MYFHNSLITIAIEIPVKRVRVIVNATFFFWKTSNAQN
jgi:hypothetical protein